MASPEGMAPPDGIPPSLHALIDTNVMLDLLLAREPWLSQAQPMWDARDAGLLVAYLPASVLTDIYYVCRKQVGTERAKQAVELCLNVIAVDRGIIATASALSRNDFEDNVQIACAQSLGLDVIVTRDVVGFAHPPIPAVEPLAVIGHHS